MMGRSKAIVILVVALVAASIVWLAGIFLNPNGVQSKVAVAGKFVEAFVDFRPSRLQSGCRDAYFGAERSGVAARDRAYPPLCYDILRLFPSEARLGGIAFAIVSGGLFILAFAIFMYSVGAPHLWTVVIATIVALSSPMLAAASNANMLTLSATGVVLWAAWWNSGTNWRRWVSLIALAFAAATKLVPAVFAICYLLERRYREFAAFALVAVVLFLAPFAWYGGFDGFCSWFANAQQNAAYYRSKAAWGIVPIDRTIRVLGGMSARDTLDWPTLGLSWAANVAIGVVCLSSAIVWKGRGVYFRSLMLVGAALLIPGNMHFYTGLYLFLPFALWMAETDDIRVSPLMALECVCWFLIFNPFQIPLGPGCVNHPLANLSFLGLLAVQFVELRRRHG